MEKIAGINFTDKEYNEIKEMFFMSDDHYIIKYKTVYQIFYSVNAGLYAEKIYQAPKDKIGFTKSGRFIFANANFTNKLIGFKLLNEEA